MKFRWRNSKKSVLNYTSLRDPVIWNVQNLLYCNNFAFIILFPIHSTAVDDKEEIDWEFVLKIQSEGDPRPMPPPDDSRQKFQFLHSLYEDAVVMPWYRNQDQPQVNKYKLGAPQVGNGILSINLFIASSTSSNWVFCIKRQVYRLWLLTKEHLFFSTSMWQKYVHTSILKVTSLMLDLKHLKSTTSQSMVCKFAICHNRYLMWTILLDASICLRLVTLIGKGRHWQIKVEIWDIFTALCVQYFFKIKIFFCHASENLQQDKWPGWPR